MDNETCYCGHVLDEHHFNNFGQASECEVEGCDCIQFEADLDRGEDADAR